MIWDAVGNASHVEVVEAVEGSVSVSGRRGR